MHGKAVDSMGFLGRFGQYILSEIKGECLKKADFLCKDKSSIHAFNFIFIRGTEETK